MPEILHDAFPPDAVSHPLPGTRPCAPGDWLRQDERFAEQMALRDRLIETQPDTVIALRPEAEPAAQELLAHACDALGVTGTDHTRPDGVTVAIDPADPLATLGRLCQEDFAIMLPGETEHWLAGGVICFPARWTLTEKLGRPLTGIHTPVKVYDDRMATRVQRLFDGVRAGHPLVRWNDLSYRVSTLHDPQPEFLHEPDRTPRYRRRERQVLVKLPETNAVAFSIHTYLVRA